MGAKIYHDEDMGISMGNHAVDPNVAIFNLPTGVAPWCNCAGCYAKKAERIYPSVLKFRKRNYVASLRDDFVPRMAKLIKRSKAGLVRVHESGDFYSQEYADKWDSINTLIPEIPFFAYSKSPYQPQSFNIVQSIFPDGEINYGPKEYAMALAEKYGVSVCPKTMTKGVKCMRHCFQCLAAKHVVFIQH